MTFKKNLPWILFAVIVVLLLGGTLGYFLGGRDLISWDRQPEYSAVYLTTGDIYFGELGWFPKLHLKNVWYLQRGVNTDNQPEVGISPFREVSWGPADKIYISREQVVWITRVREDSQLAQALGQP